MDYSRAELLSTPNTVERALSVAMAGNFVEGNSSGKVFKFSHNCVQACLLSMICNPNERASLEKTMQTPLTAQTSDIEDVETIRFLSVHSWSPAQQLPSSKGAYYSSRDYLRHAIVNLTTESWTTNYDLSLRVHEHSAEMEHCTGFLSLSKERVDKVLKCATRKEDTTFVYQTYVASLANAGFLEEAPSVGFDAMHHLNVKFPRTTKVNTAHVVVELVKTHRTVKRFTFDEILQLPEATNPGILMVFNIMNHVGLCAFHLGERGKNIVAVIALRAMRLSLTHGLVTLTSHALSSYGAILSILGNVTAVCDFGELAQQVSTKLQAHGTKARMILSPISALYSIGTPR